MGNKIGAIKQSGTGHQDIPKEQKKTKFGTFFSCFFKTKKESHITATVPSKNIPASTDAAKKKAESSQNFLSKMIAGIRNAFKKSKPVKAKVETPIPPALTEEQELIILKNLPVAEQKKMAQRIMNELMNSEKHLKKEGIVRESADKSDKIKFIEQFILDDQIKFPDDTNILIGALKEILKNFHGGKGLINQEVRDEFLKIDNSKYPEELMKIGDLKAAIEKLPLDNKEILKDFCELATSIDENSEINKMTLDNIINSMGLSLLPNESSYTGQFNNILVYGVLKLLIEFRNVIFLEEKTGA